MKKTLLSALLAATSLFAKAQSLNDSLLLYLQFDGNANDASGHNNHGTAFNTQNTTDRFGIANRAFYFNGNNSYVKVTPSASLNKIHTSDGITISAWINIHDWYQGWNVFALLEQHDPATDWGSLLLEANWSSGGILFASRAGYGEWTGYNYNWTPAFNQWHHIAITHQQSAGIAKCYIDGVLISTNNYIRNAAADYTNFYAVGRSLMGTDEYSDGAIDELKIYNRALGTEEIAQLLDPVDIGVGVRPVSDEHINIYPNPSRGNVFISGAKPDGTVTIVNTIGQVVLREKVRTSVMSLNTESLPRGVYILYYDNNKTSNRLKLVKE